ncbi:MAG: prolyl oligopeptidase family serine peptidase [Lachnospiraceae bacterium]|nr:prolyl oligopeptidase family serine peptidase [Lachnospiraceae bacterium]
MLLPPDWDRPDKDNGLLCSKFRSAIWHGEDGFYFKYRFYKPSVKEGDRADILYPLAVYIHGADAFGDDNSLQLEMHDIGTVFARDDWQEKEPCYILAPQCRMDRHWSRNDTTAMLHGFINDFIEKQGDIDSGRIYVYGYSAGGIGTLNLLKKHPDFYAGAIPICGATSGEDIKELLNTPIWLVHAEDDRIVKATYGNPGEGSKFYLGSADIYEVLRKYHGAGIDIRYTGYPAGWMDKIFGVNPHCSWVAVSDERQGAEIRKWLFRQKRRSL